MTHTPNKTPQLQRLHKVMAAVGIASRRKAEALILEGAVTVNGRIITELGTKVDPQKDAIKVNGKMLYTEVPLFYVAFNKPAAVLSSLFDPEGRPTLQDYIGNIKERLLPIGRLDFTSEGLLLLTNDGTLINQITKARNIPKTYTVKVKGHYKPEDLEFLARGVFTSEGVMRFRNIRIHEKLRNKTWISFEIVEGSGLNLREILNHKGILVDRIVRTTIGSIGLEDMEPGQWRYVTKEDFLGLLNTQKDGETFEGLAKVSAEFRSTRKAESLNPWAERRRKEKEEKERAAHPRARKEQERSKGKFSSRNDQGSSNDQSYNKTSRSVQKKPTRRYASAGRTGRS